MEWFFIPSFNEFLLMVSTAFWWILAVAVALLILTFSVLLLALANTVFGFTEEISGLISATTLYLVLALLALATLLFFGAIWLS